MRKSILIALGAAALFASACNPSQYDEEENTVPAGAIPAAPDAEYGQAEGGAAAADEPAAAAAAAPDSATRTTGGAVQSPGATLDTVGGAEVIR